MLKYRDIENLDPNDPLVKQFYFELERDAEYEEGSLCILDDEDSLSYFNRYIAGDR